MPRSDTTIAADHYPRLAIESLDVTLFHRVSDIARSAIPHDLHVEINRSYSLLPADLFHVLKLILRMSTTAHNRDVRWSTNVGQTTRHINWIEVSSTRNKHSNRRAPRIVGITIRGDVEPTRTCTVDQRNRLRRLSPNRDAAKFYMRDLHRNPRFPADANRFLERFEGFVSFVANVTDVDTIERISGARECNHFLERRWSSSFVLESCRQANRAIAHGLLNQLLHLLHFVWSCMSIRFLAHHKRTQRCMADKREHVQGNRAFVE